MKIIIQEDEAIAETEISIRCKKADAQIVRLLANLRALDHKLTGEKDGKTYIVDEGRVLYFESVDKKTFVYTDDAVLETPLRLYELEERLSGASFFRASKSAILNIAKIASLRPEFGGRIEVTLMNGERMLVSRQYAPKLRAKLGL